MTEDMTAYFTADEFLICCAAAGIERLYGFSLPDGPLTRRGAAQGLFSLVRRGFLLCEEDTFTLCPELSGCFTLLRESGTVVFAYQRRYSLRQPCCLLYGGGERFVSLTPGLRRADYAGVKQYEDEDGWLLDMGLAPEETFQDDLEELTDRKRNEACPGLIRFAAGGPAPCPLPEAVFGYLESRRLADWRLTARAILVRQALYDCIVAGADGRAETLSMNRLAGIVREMRMGRMTLR